MDQQQPPTNSGSKPRKSKSGSKERQEKRPSPARNNRESRIIDGEQTSKLRNQRNKSANADVIKPNQYEP